MDDQTISADEFMKGDPVGETPAAAPVVAHAPAARTHNKFTPQQYNDYVRLVRDKNTTPDQLVGWFKDNGIGQTNVNADQVLSFAHRNPNARVPNLWIGVPVEQQQSQPTQQAPADAPYSKIPDWQKLPLSELNKRTGKNYVGLDANGLPVEDPNHAKVDNPPLPSWGQRFVRSMRETFDPAGGGVNAFLMRAGEDVKSDDVIRQWGSDHNWTGKQIDDAIARAKQDRGRQITDTRQQQTLRDNDEAAREGGGILGSVKRGSADLGGSITGDVNPSYLFAPEIKGVSAGVEKIAPAVGRALERVLPQAAARGAVPVVEHALEAAAPTTGRMAGQGLQQGGLNVATQADEVDHGIRDHINPAEVGIHALLGSVLQGGAEALGAAAPRVASWVGDKINPGRVVNREGLNSLESDLALLADRGVAPDHFNNIEEVRAAAQKIREAPTAEPEGGAVAPEQPPVEEPSSNPADDVIKRMTSAINDAGKVTTEQQQLYTEARRQRLAKVQSIRENTSGEAGFRAELAQLKGAMPRAEFAPVRDKFTQTDVDTLFNHIRDAPQLTPFEQINARTALSNMLDGKAPTPSEIGLLSQVFPSDFMKAVAKQRSMGRKFSDLMGNALNLPRALMSSMDLSAPFRQGVFLVGRKEFWKSFAGMFKQFGSERAFNAVRDNIRARPTYPLMEESGLAMTGMKGGLSNHEEQFMSEWAEKLPIIGIGVRASERAYTGFLNKLRADTFDTLVALHRKAGINLEFEPTVLKDIARFINSATGRGDLHGKIGQAAPLLNGLFFSPRLIKARADMLNPVTYMTYSPIVRREAVKSLLSFGAIGSTVLGLAAAGGMKVGTDPRSSDFGKAVDGNTHYDIFGGFSQFITLGARLLTNETVTTGSHEVKTLGKDFGSPTRLNVIERFFENKAAPVPSFIMDYFRGKNAVGQDFDPKNTNPMDNSITQRFIPMFMQDLYDVVRDRGPEGFAMAVPSLFGVGVNTYSSAPNKQGFMGGTPVPQKGAKPAAAATAPSQEPPKEISAEQFMEGTSPDEPAPEPAASAPVPKQSTFENSIASDVLSNMGLRITDNGIRSHKDQERYFRTTHGAAPPGSSRHEIGDAIDIAVPHDVSVGDITSALEKAGLKGVDIITRRHGTAPHWHISWQGSE